MNGFNQIAEMHLVYYKFFQLTQDRRGGGYHNQVVGINVSVQVFSILGLIYQVPSIEEKVSEELISLASSRPSAFIEYRLNISNEDHSFCTC